MRHKYASAAAKLYHEAARLRKLATDMEKQASRMMEAQTSIEYDMEDDARDGTLSVLDSAVNPKDDGEVDKMVDGDRSAISEDPDMDFSGLIDSNDFRPRKKDNISIASRIRRRSVSED